MPDRIGVYKDRRAGVFSRRFVEMADGTYALKLATISGGAGDLEGVIDDFLIGEVPVKYADQGDGTYALIVSGISGGAHPDLATHDALGLATDAELTTHAGAADPHAGYRLETADHSHQSTGFQGGQLDHGLALTGLGDDDHPQYALDTDLTTHAGAADPHTGYVREASAEWVDLTDAGETTLHSHAAGGHPDLATHDALGLATDAELTTHAGAADPHTGYRLESADHSHQTTGLQAGKIDHGAALDGLADDDHPQYALDSDLHARAHDPVAAADHPVSGQTPGHVLTVQSGGASVAWQAPSGGAAADLTYNPGGNSTIADGKFRIYAKRFELTGTDRLTVEGNARLLVI